MDSNALAGMLFTLVLAALVGGFILLYPLSRQLGKLVESKLSPRDTSRAPGVTDRQLEEVRTALVAVREELERLGERQEFVEQLLERTADEALPVGRQPERGLPQGG
ncbi:MAG: hypothetical protein ACRELD_13300 [Longimicrobiales bacterium]